MISSLPKPLQNDFDTIVIDILSRYSLDNKSVKRFVESVAQQARDINRQPRFLKEAKRSRGQKAQDSTEDTLSGGKEKPNFLTRVQGYQSAWNRGSLVGVFLEYLKNKREDQQAKLVQSKQDSITGPTKEKADSQPAAQTVKTERKIIERFTDKTTETRTNTLERVVNNLQKIQEIFSSPGLLGATKNILSVYKESGLAKPITPITSSTSYTAPTYSTSLTNNENIKLTQGEAQAQRQDLLKEEQVIILGGINDKGARDLRKVFKSIFDEQKELFLKGIASTTAAGGAISGDSEAAAESSLLDFLADLGMASSLLPSRRRKGGSKPSKPRSKPKEGSKPSKPGPKPKESPKPKGGPKAAPRKGGIPKMKGAGGILLPIVTAIEAITNIGESVSELSEKETLSTPQKVSAGVAALGGGAADIITSIDPTSWGLDKMLGADIFGEGLLKEALNVIGAKKEDQTMGESLRERMTEMWESVNDYLENELEVSKKFGDEKLGWEDLLPMLGGLGLTPEMEKKMWNQLKMQPEMITSFTNYIKSGKTEESKKAFEDTLSKFYGKPIKLQDLNSNVKPLPTLNPDVKPLPPGATPADIEKKPPLKITYPDTQKPPESLRLINPSPVLGKGKMESLTPLTPQLAKPISPVPPSITETHVTNNNADKKVLADIAGNTEKTNHSLATLGDAVFKLAKVFDSKTMGGGNSVLINNNGQAQEYTSTAQIAANNVDSTRRVRQQFLAAMS